MKKKTKLKNKHHPWCNWFMRPRENCWLCERLYKAYPPLENDEDSLKLLKKHFPDVIPMKDKL